jgi:hypothetical protein
MSDNDFTKTKKNTNENNGEEANISEFKNFDINDENDNQYGIDEVYDSDEDVEETVYYSDDDEIIKKNDDVIYLNINNRDIIVNNDEIIEKGDDIYEYDEHEEHEESEENKDNDDKNNDDKDIKQTPEINLDENSNNSNKKSDTNDIHDTKHAKSIYNKTHKHREQHDKQLYRDNQKTRSHHIMYQKFVKSTEQETFDIYMYIKENVEHNCIPIFDKLSYNKLTSFLYNPTKFDSFRSIHGFS